MSFNSADDRWLLPRRQTEYPARALLPEATLHGRREATCLVLAALFFVATTAMLVLGTSRVIDVASVLAAVAPGVELANAAFVPLGALPFALSFVAAALVCELFGRRRASALVWIGLVASVAIVGLMRVADLVDGGEAFGSTVAFASCFVVAHACHLVVFDALRRRSYGRQLATRMSASALLALTLGWAAFALVLRSGQGILVEPIAWDTILAVAIGAASWTAVSALVLAMLAGVVGRALAVALRVGPDWLAGDDAQSEPEEPVWAQPRPALAEGSVSRRLPQAQIVDEHDDVAVPAQRRARAVSVPPFTSAELRFFSEGDEAS